MQEQILDGADAQSFQLDRAFGSDTAERHHRRAKGGIPVLIAVALIAGTLAGTWFSFKMEARRRLPVALQEELGQGFEGGGAAFEPIQGRERPTSQARRDASRFLQSNQSRVSRLLCLGVLTGGLAQLLAGLGDVQDVIDDLEGQADIVAEISEGLKLGAEQLALIPPNRTEAQSRAEVLRSWIY